MSPFEDRAERHQARGNAHLANGNPDYAEASFRKAQRARDRSRMFEAALGDKHGPLLPRDDLMRRYRAEVSERIGRRFERAVLVGSEG